MSKTQINIDNKKLNKKTVLINSLGRTDSSVDNGS